METKLGDPTVEDDYEQAILRLVDVTARLMRALPSSTEELCAEGRNMLQVLLVAAPDLDDAAQVRVGSYMHEHNVAIKFRSTGVAPHDRVMRLIFTVTKLCTPRGRRIAPLCESALAQLDRIEAAVNPAVEALRPQYLLGPQRV